MKNKLGKPVTLRELIDYMKTRENKNSIEIEVWDDLKEEKIN